MKADWNRYSAELDKLTEDVEPIPANYKCFVESVHIASRRHIPRGCRTEYISGLTNESKSLYEAYKLKYSSSPFDDGTKESRNTLNDKMMDEKRKRWEEVTHNSHKVWKTIRKHSNHLNHIKYHNDLTDRPETTIDPAGKGIAISSYCRST